ncbi:DUF5615 family PIN-like protein [Chlorogloeopsis fritschii PCC 9212]|uniref:DUF5615 family PIN-like protein n=1 Tax=Chlorogloeopsis fritschii TaxID=1124 RepID=UPI00370D9536
MHRPAVARWLRNQAYEVFSVYEEARGMSDDDVLQKAVDENWILITNDKDFGEKIYRDGRSHRGVIFLRLADERAVNKIETFNACLRAMRNAYPISSLLLQRIEFGLHSYKGAKLTVDITEPIMAVLDAKSYLDTA